MGRPQAATTCPNKGGGGAITNDVVRGDVHVVLVNAASSAGLAKAGMIRVLAVMSDQRLPDYPDAPTLKELGYAAGEGLWSALYAPAKTPHEVLETLHKATVAGAQVRAGADDVRQADDQGHSRRLSRRGAGLEQARNRALEAPDRDGQDRGGAVARADKSLCLDSGLAPFGAPRNDRGRYGDTSSSTRPLVSIANAR